jgi:hypothetical protein
MQLQNTGLNIDGSYVHIIEDGTYHYEYLSVPDAATQFVITEVPAQSNENIGLRAYRSL